MDEVKAEVKKPEDMSSGEIEEIVSKATPEFVADVIGHNAELAKTVLKEVDPELLKQVLGEKGGEIVKAVEEENSDDLKAALKDVTNEIIAQKEEEMHAE